MIFSENGVILNEGFFKKVSSSIKDKYDKFDYDNPIPNNFSSQAEADKFSRNYSKKNVLMLKELVNMCKTLDDYKWVKKKIQSFIRAEQLGSTKTNEYINQSYDLISICDKKINEIKMSK